MLIQRSSCGLKIPPQEVLAFRKFYRKEVLAVLTSNRKEVLAACRIQAQATRKKPQEVAGLRTQKEVLARALFLGCTVDALRPFTWTLYSNTNSYFTTLQVSLLNTIKTNKIIRIFKAQELHLDIYCSSWFIEYPFYPIACWLPYMYLRSSVYNDS